MGVDFAAAGLLDGLEGRARESRPGLQPLWARRLGGGRTVPFLVLDGETIGDSTAIVAELERRWPEPALYPAEPSSASAPWRWRTSSTRSSATRCAGWRSTPLAATRRSPTPRWA